MAIPELVEDYGWKINEINRYKGDRAVMLKLYGQKKGLANEWKRSRGKRVMMRKIGLVTERRAEEVALMEKSKEADCVTLGP